MRGLAVGRLPIKTSFCSTPIFPRKNCVHLEARARLGWGNTEERERSKIHHVSEEDAGFRNTVCNGRLTGKFPRSYGRWQNIMQQRSYLIFSPQELLFLQPGDVLDAIKDVRAEAYKR